MASSEQLILLVPHVETADVQQAIAAIDAQNPAPVLAQPKGGVLEFAETIFGDADRSRIFAQKFNREPTGRGPHFDVYNDFIDPEHPIIGVYNLTGHATLRAVVLSEKLQEYYDETYPEPSHKAFEQRRNLSRLAFEEPKGQILEGNLLPGIGMILPQSVDGRHLVHDIVPEVTPRTKKPESEIVAGSFVKFVLPKDARAATEHFKTRGYAPLNQFFEVQVSGVTPQENEPNLTSPTPPIPPRSANPSKHPEKRPIPGIIQRILSRQSKPAEPTPPQRPTKRSCDLD